MNRSAVERRYRETRVDSSLGKVLNGDKNAGLSENGCLTCQVVWVFMVPWRKMSPREHNGYLDALPSEGRLEPHTLFIRLPLRRSLAVQNDQR